MLNDSHALDNRVNASKNASLSSHGLNLARKGISKELHISLPSQFYHSASVYDLERRAIFSKRWILISHEARYRDVGDFVQYEMAGFNFVLLRNKTGRIVAFHNVCRHRGHPIIQKSSGHASILTCRYHGWSYDLNGKLTKAPRFTSDAVPEFDASSVKLSEIYVHVDRNGFVYINLDARNDGPAMSWEEQYEGLDQQTVLIQSGIDWNTVEYDFTWVKEGKYNWKLMQENYNECYHCLTAHPAVAKTTRLDTYYVEPNKQGTYICHFSEPKATPSAPQSTEPQNFTSIRFNSRSATHVFPVGHFSPNPGTGFMHLMRTIPTSATTVRQEYDVYKLNTPTATPEAHQNMVEFYKQVTGEDVELCEAVQKNMEREVVQPGTLHPFTEEGVLAFQQAIKRMLTEHLDDEEKAGRKIYPAQETSQLDECSRRLLACSGDGPAGIDW